MQVSIEEIRGCLERANELGEQYKLHVLNGAAKRRSTDQLLWIVREYLQKQVTVYRLALRASQIAAFYWAMRDGTYKVFLASGMSDDQDRFALAKELFHVVLDEVECRNMNLYGHIAEVLASFPVRESKPQRSTISEQLAEAAAMEFMFPYSERLVFLAKGDGNPDYGQAADRFGIPQYLVELYCSDDYMSFYSKF